MLNGDCGNGIENGFIKINENDYIINKNMKKIINDFINFLVNRAIQ